MLESFISTGISTVESHATVESHGREYTLSESQVLEKVALRKESSTANIRESELGKNTVLDIECLDKMLRVYRPYVIWYSQNLPDH